MFGAAQAQLCRSCSRSQRDPTTPPCSRARSRARQGHFPWQTAPWGSGQEVLQHRGAVTQPCAGTDARAVTAPWLLCFYHQLPRLGLAASRAAGRSQARLP